MQEFGFGSGMDEVWGRDNTTIVDGSHSANCSCSTTITQDFVAAYAKCDCHVKKLSDGPPAVGSATKRFGIALVSGEEKAVRANNIKSYSPQVTDRCPMCGEYINLYAVPPCDCALRLRHIPQSTSSSPNISLS